jgi:lantibiotic leader peptide-processing serine protease
MTRSILSRTVRVLSLFVLAACTSDGAISPSPLVPTESVATLDRQATTLTAVPGSFVISLRGPASMSSVRQRVQALGATVRAELPQVGVMNVRNLSLAGAKSLASVPGVSQITQDFSAQWIPKPTHVLRKSAEKPSELPRHSGTDQSDALFFADQWNIRQIKSDVAWNVTPAGSGETVCIVDSGIDPDHIDLAGKVNLAKTRSFVSNPAFPGDLEIFDYNFHGSFVAGIVSTNGLGIASVASDAKLCALKVLRVDGTGEFGDLIAAIVYAGDIRADVINFSLGVYLDTTIPGVPALLAVLQRAIDFAHGKGSVVVAGAGNDAINLDHDESNMLQVPAQMRNVLSVGATAPINQQNFDMLASYSNFGGRTGIDFVAPGGDFVAGSVVEDLVLSVCSSYQLTLGFPCSTTDFVFANGTSAAAPHVSGAAAVLESHLGTQPSSTLVRCLKNRADYLNPEAIFGTGRLNVLRSSQCS